MMNTKPAIAVDLGGTSIKAGIVAGAEVLAAESIPANSREGLAPQLPRMAGLINRLCAARHLEPSDCLGIGMAVPFLVDPVRQRIRSAPRKKYGDACEVDLAAWSRKEFGMDLRIENDAHAALLGEWRYGAGRGSDDFVMITLGTGIGCSVLIRGKLLRGKHFQAGVLGGHLIANPEDGAACSACPASGCYEAESAAQCLPRLARANPQFARSALAGVAVTDFAAVFRYAADGDVLATALRDHCLRHWTALIISLVHAYDPDRVVIGGGVADGAEVRALFPSIETYVNKHAWIVEPVEIRAAALGNRAGMIGVSTLLARTFAFI